MVSSVKLIAVRERRWLEMTPYRSAVGSSCPPSADTRGSFWAQQTAVWVITQFDKALDKEYQLAQIAEVCHFERWGKSSMVTYLFLWRENRKPQGTCLRWRTRKAGKSTSKLNPTPVSKLSLSIFQGKQSISHCPLQSIRVFWLHVFRKI